MQRFSRVARNSRITATLLARGKLLLQPGSLMFVDDASAFAVSAINIIATGNSQCSVYVYFLVNKLQFLPRSSLDRYIRSSVLGFIKSAHYPVSFESVRYFHKKIFI